MKGMEIIGGVHALVFLFSCLQFDESGCFFSLKPSPSQGESSLNFSSLGFAVLEELGNKQTDTEKNMLLPEFGVASLTIKLLASCSYSLLTPYNLI